MENYEEKDGGRWCEECNKEHGVYFICEKYPEYVKIKIEKQKADWINKLKDPKWLNAQVKKGVPREVIQILRTFADIKED